MTALALDGGNNVHVTHPTGINNGWKTFEVLTGDDSLGSLAQESFSWTSTKHKSWDGLGAYRHDTGTLRVFINHEAGSNASFSRVDLNVPNLQAWIAAGIPNNSNSNQVIPAGPIVKAVSLGWLTVGSGSNPINNPCSGNVWLADTFGAGRGFSDTLYLTGEETFSSSGKFWVMDVATRTLYHCPDLGGGSWENACIIDTGRTDTIALVLAEDDGSSSSGTAPLRLYVGLKNPAGNFLARNGLSGGTVYHWDPVGSSTNGTMSGIFSAGNGTVVNGTWTTSSSNAAKFSKLEDVHTNMRPSSPGYGVEVAVGSQGQAIFKVDFSQVDFVAGNLGTNRDSGILVLFEAGTDTVPNNLSGMDNLVWSADGNIYVNEDDSEGDIWQIDVDSLEASYAASDFTPDTSQVFDILDADTVSETSGIIDISEEVDFEPGSIFLTSGQSTTLNKNQLMLLVSPAAVAMPGLYTMTVTTEIDETGGSGNGVGTSLREAIAEVPAGGTINFAPSMNGKVIALTLGELVIDKPLIVDASALSMGVTIDGGSNGDLVVNSGETRCLRITDGNAGKDMNVLLRHLTIRRGVSAAAEAGANVHNRENLTLENCSILDGRAVGSSADGGGIFSKDGSLTIIGTTVADNIAGHDGGGVFSEDNLTSTNSTFAKNMSGSGAAIRCGSSNPSLTLRHTTVTANTGGFAIVNAGGTVLENSIATGNSAGNQLTGVVTLLGGNLTNGSPGLAPLANYGGPTMTMPPLPGSPAIEAAVLLVSSPSLDQRGAARPSGPLPDLGAVEAVAFALLGLGDTDADGIPDVLEGPGGPYPHLTVGVNDSAIDTDGDGSTDAEEIGAMTGVFDPTSKFRIFLFEIDAELGGGSHRVLVGFTTFPGLSYTAEISSDLDFTIKRDLLIGTSSGYTIQNLIILNFGEQFLRLRSN